MSAHKTTVDAALVCLGLAVIAGAMWFVMSLIDLAINVMRLAPLGAI
ncbi:hypothetical protein [Sphingopyxis witflariensis]|nr:hypothetical protein [Sphingopyxis witflariensis]